MNEAQEKLCAICLEGTEMPDCPLLEQCEQYKILQKEVDDMGCPCCEWFEGRVWHLEDNVIALVNTLREIKEYVGSIEDWARQTILSKIEEGDGMEYEMSCVEWSVWDEAYRHKKARIRSEVEKLLSIRYIPTVKGVYKVEMRDAQTAPSVDEVVETIMAIVEE